MRIVTIEEAARAAQQGGHIEPRVVMSGNFAAPVQLVEAVLAQLPSVRLHALNAQRTVTMHDGVIPETAFVGPGFRHHPRLSYVPCRLSQVPTLFHRGLDPDIVVLHLSLIHI